MSYASAALSRRPAPRVRRCPESVSSDADDAIFLSANYGLVPDEWQELVLRDWLGRRTDGRWSAGTCGLAVPRQNGKNGVIEVRELFGMVELGEKFLHTAHQVKTARKAFLRIASFFENDRQFPELAALVKEIRKTNGQEAVILHNGGSVEFIARSKNSGRGFTVDVLVLDEAQDLTDGEIEALLPTISAAPTKNPQVIFTGTPPDPDKGETGEVFVRIRQEGEQGSDPRLAWTDYGVRDGDLPDVTDDELLFAVNPALGNRLALEEILRERKVMSPEGIARERYGWWGTGKPRAGGFDFSNWERLADPSSEPDGPATYGVAVSLDRDWAAISVAGTRSDGLWHIDGGHHRRGTGWVVSTCVDIDSRFPGSVFVVDGGGPGGSLIPELEAAGLRVETAGLRDAAAACALVVDAVKQQKLRHRGQTEVDNAVESAKPRMSGDGLVLLGRKASGHDISPLEAASLALWMACQTVDVAESVW